MLEPSWREQPQAINIMSGYDFRNKCVFSFRRNNVNDEVDLSSGRLFHIIYVLLAITKDDLGTAGASVCSQRCQLDYCNALLTETADTEIKWLQSVQNTVDRLVSEAHVGRRTSLYRVVQKAMPVHIFARIF